MKKQISETKINFHNSGPLYEVVSKANLTLLFDEYTVKSVKRDRTRFWRVSAL